MEKIFQVFVSSTFEDLQEERKEVMQALLELDCMPAGMELFPASNEDQWTLIKRVIDACDYYLLIVGGRYGSTTGEGKSYTQMEFEYALATDKPIISFLPKNPESIPSGKCEKDGEKREKLEAFKELAKKKLVKYWESPEQLGSVVSRSMVKLIKDFPAEGWVRAGSAVDEKSVKEIAKLQRENESLKEQLKTIATQAPIGTEALSQGNEQVEIRYSFSAEDRRGFQAATCDNEEPYSWNDLFACIAPKMIDECTDSAFEYGLNKYIEEHSNWMRIREFSGLRNAKGFTISQESFGIIKVQFRALGLIASGEKKRSASDKQSYWKLTPYGDYVMTQLLAIKRSDCTGTSKPSTAVK
jgi:hypothetical protein